jgi:8-oxo-dGTP pyrophosphatase MutT (NUDIX family)
LQQAKREIREETGITDTALRLVAQGEPLEVPDSELQVCWIVYPFLFEIDDREGIRLDWENTELCWVAPERVQAFATVPKLAEALQRCLEREDG